MDFKCSKCPDEFFVSAEYLKLHEQWHEAGEPTAEGMNKDRVSALAKLQKLGLTEAEVQALIGYREVSHD